MAEPELEQADETGPEGIELPAPVAWPLVLALGVTLLAASLVTQWAVAVAGLLLVVLGAAGWIRELMPGQGHIHEEITAARPTPIVGRPGAVELMKPDQPGYRMQMPEHLHPYSAGLKGGLAGGVAMALVAIGYGLVSGHGIWYPVNLLAGTVIDLPRLPDGSVDIPLLHRFNLGWFLIGLLIHGVSSISVGLVYGVVLPTLPHRRFLWGGLVAPLLWSGGLYAFLGVLNPALRQHVDWYSFVLAQFAYGIVVDIVVMRSERIYLGPVARRPETDSQ